MKKMRKLIAAVAAAALVLSMFSFFSVGTFAEGTPATLKVDTVEADPGQTLTIPVTISQNPGFSSYSFGFEFDHDLITLNEAVADEAIGGQFTYAVRLVWLRSGDYTEDGTIALLNVTVSGDAEPGSFIPIKLLCEKGFFANYDEDDVDFVIVNGGVKVKGGDIPLIDASTVFSDVKKEDWFCEYVSYVYTHGIMKGVSDDTFSPNGAMSRAMLVTVLWRVEGSPAASPAPFTDIRDDWYAGAVAWAYSTGIVKGMTEKSFAPDDPLSREQIAAILFRYASYKGADVSGRADISSFPDYSSVSEYAREAFSFAVYSGLIEGVLKDGAKYLSPKGNATRAQVSTIITRYLRAA